MVYPGTVFQNRDETDALPVTDDSGLFFCAPMPANPLFVAAFQPAVCQADTIHR